MRARLRAEDRSCEDSSAARSGRCDSRSERGGLEKRRLVASRGKGDEADGSRSGGRMTRRSRRGSGRPVCCCVCGCRRGAS